MNMNEDDVLKWTQQEAVNLAKIVESFAPDYGCHVGLTGGCLYREGPRKDCDLLFYRIRQAESIDIEGLLKALESIGVIILRGFGFCYKCAYGLKDLDLLIPEEPGEYIPGEQTAATEEILQPFEP